MSLARSGLLLLAIAGLCGCTKSETAAPPKVYADLSAQVRPADLTVPLSADELSAFVEIMRELPRIADTQMLSPEMFVDAESTGIDQFRRHLRQRLEAEFLSQRWLSEPRTLAILQKFHVEPRAFATLTLRVSAAWSACVMSEQVRLPAVQRSVEIELARMIRDLENNSQLLARMDREQLQESIRNCVALSEFVWLLQQVPQGSLATVASCDAQLRDVLPHSDGNSSFARRFESKAEILKTGWSESH